MATFALWLALSAQCGAQTGASAEPLPVRFAPEKNYGPFVFADADGAARGLSVDLLQLLQRQAGLLVTTLPAASLDAQLQAVREGRVDLVSSLRPTAERAAYLAFSIPYVSVPAILVRRAGSMPKPMDSDGTPSDGLAGMAGQTVAVGQGYAVEPFVRGKFPQVAWTSVPDDLVALRGVADGRYAAAVVDAASASFVQRLHRLRTLQSAGPVGFDYLLSFAVPRQRSDLLARIDAGIRAIPVEERAAVVDRWLAPLHGGDAMGSRWQSGPVAWGLGLIALAGAAGLWLLLRAHGRRRTKALTEGRQAQ